MTLPSDDKIPRTIVLDAIHTFTTIVTSTALLLNLDTGHVRTKVTICLTHDGAQSLSGQPPGWGERAIPKAQAIGDRRKTPTQLVSVAKQESRGHPIIVTTSHRRHVCTLREAVDGNTL
jgi:hypothetical protein